MVKSSPSLREIRPQGWKVSSEPQPPFVSHATKSTKKGPKWLRSEFETLVRLKIGGESWDDISKLIPRHNAEQCNSKWRCRNQVLKTENIKSPWSKADNQSLYTLFREDRDWEAISQKLGRSAGACIQHLDEYFTGLSDNSQWPWTHNEDHLLAALWQQGMPFATMWRILKDRTGPLCSARWNNHLKFRPDYQVAWSPEEDNYLLSLRFIPVTSVFMPSHITINGRSIRRPATECNRRKNELTNPATKSVSVLKTSTLDASRTAKSNSWTEHGKKQLVDLYEADKNWYQICLLLQEDHTAADCRSYWLEHYWDSFHKLMVDGKLDVAELEKLGWKAGEKTIVEEEEEEEEGDGNGNGKNDEGHKMNREGAATTKKGKEVDAHRSFFEEEDDWQEEMEEMVEYDDEADGERDTEEADRQEEMVEYDDEADGEGDTDEDLVEDEGESSYFWGMK